MELASFDYTIRYRPGKANVAADAFTRAYCASINSSSLADIHASLGHPGVTRMLHFVKCRNLPFSTSDVKRTCNSCELCAEMKPRFFKKPPGKLIRATQPWERISIDFKGPLESSTPNKYLLNIVDEYSRFPFSFPCKNVETKTVIEKLDILFSLCGTPGRVHSDRGKQLCL